MTFRMLLVTVLTATSLGATCPAATARPAGDLSSAAPARVVISFDLAFQPDGSASGHFAAAGALSDVGPANADPVVAPLNATVGRLTGQLILHGSQGQLTWDFTGTTGPLGAPRAVARGVTTLLSTSGEYTGLVGRGSFVTVADFVTGHVIGLIEASVHQPDGA